MGFWNHETEYAGKRIVFYTPGDGIEDPAATMPHLFVEYDSESDIQENFAALLAEENSDQITGLSIGMWGQEMYEESPSAILEALVAASSQLPNLEALFIGHMISEENEVSWIYMCDISAIWSAFPRLEHLRIRGSMDLSLGKTPQHGSLKSLIIECGGLPKNVLKEIASAKFPMLEHLELYLGEENYGWNGEVRDVLPLLETDLFPKLKFLGLRDSEIADDVAKAVSDAPILEQIEILDLSLGNLSDAGAEFLVTSEGIRKLRKLDLHHHYLSEAMCDRLRQLGLPELDVSDPQEADDDYRYIAVGE